MPEAKLLETNQDLLSDEVRRIIIRVFKISSDSVPAKLDTESVERWDSVGHMQLIEEISCYFDVDITHAEAIKMLSQESVVKVLLAKSKKYKSSKNARPSE